MYLIKIKEENPHKRVDSTSRYSHIFNSVLDQAPSDEVIGLFLNYLQKRYDLSEAEVLELIQRKSSEELLPINIFDNDKLSALEAISKYLKENLTMGYNEIGEMLNRDERGIWTTYHNANKKMPECFAIKPSKFFIPLTLFADRKLSILEHIVKYLKEEFSLTYHQIAVILHRNDRTIWTVYSRAKKKGVNK